MHMTSARHRQDLAGGLLRSEQYLTWDAPSLSPEMLEEVPQLLERAHFRSIERFSLGFIRCYRDADGVTCRLLGKGSMLRFAGTTDVVSPTRVTRRWTILPGLFVRRVNAAPDAPDA